MSEIILFIGAILVAGAAVGVFVSITGILSDNVETVGERVSDSASTDIKIIDDVRADNIHQPGESSVDILVKNTGESEIVKTEIDVLVNGVFQEPSNVTILTGSSWITGGVVRITVSDANIRSGENRISVQVLRSEDTIRFTT